MSNDFLRDTTRTGNASVVQRKHVVCLTCSVIFVIIGIILATCGTLIIDAIIRQELPMKDRNSLLFQVWQDSANKGLPLLRNFYMWNLTNPYEVFFRTEIPNFVKVGPYVYREHLYAPEESISWSDDSTRLHFNYFSNMSFAPELSVDPVFGQLTENDTFTTLNLALWAAAYRLDHLPKKELAELACLDLDWQNFGRVLGTDGYFVQPQVSQYLFGYTDNVWLWLQTFSKPENYSTPSRFNVVFNGSQPAPSAYTYATGLKCPIWDNQSECNSSAASTCTIYTGVDDIQNTAQYTRWAGQSDLWWWSGVVPDYPPNASAVEPMPSTTEAPTADQSCHILQGSNAMNYPPGLTKDSTPYIYVDNIFRTVKLQYVQDAEVNGIPTLQFRVNEDEKSVDSPNAKCYDQRYPSVFNLTRPYFAPMLVSQPYFWGVLNPQDVFVDEYDLPAGQNSTMLNFTINGTHINDLLQNFDPSDAELVLRVEPHTGTLLEGRGRIQMATWMRPITIQACQNVSGLEGWAFEELEPWTIDNRTTYFPYTMMPIMYLDRTVVAPQSLSDKIYYMVILPILLCKVVGGIVAGLAAVGGVAMAYVLRKRHTMKSEAEHSKLLQ